MNDQWSGKILLSEVRAKRDRPSRSSTQRLTLAITGAPPPSLAARSAEGAVAALAGGEAGGAGLRLTRADHGRATGCLVRQRAAEVHRPLLVGREPVRPQAQLREGCQLPGQLDGRREGAARGDQAVGEAHALRLLAGHTAAGEDEVEGVAVAEQAGQADRAAV